MIKAIFVLFDSREIQVKEVENKMIKKLEKIAKHMHLLYVDDNKALCDTYLSFFQDIFQSVDCALDGKEGLALYQNKKYDLVITDINMPRMNGFNFIKAMKKINPDQAVIIVSAYSEIAYLSKLNQCDIDHFLVKPVDTKELIEKIYLVIEDMCVHE
jgi:YesN/AraC family two-component response regulator